MHRDSNQLKVLNTEDIAIRKLLLRLKKSHATEREPRKHVNILESATRDNCDEDRMMSKTRSILAVGLLAWGSISSTSAANLPQIVTVGIPTGLPGYRLLPGGEMEILDARKKEATGCIEERIHAKFKWVDFPTKRLLQKLANAEVDLIYPMGFNALRASQYLQSAWTWQNPDVFVSLKSVDPSDLALAVGAKLGSPQETDYLADGYSSVQTAYEYGDLPRMLNSRTVDAVVVPKSVYLEMAPTWPAGVQTSPGKARGIGFYLNKKDPKGLLKLLNDSIVKCRIQAPPAHN